MTKNNPNQKGESFIRQLASLKNVNDLIVVKEGRKLHSMYFITYAVEKNVWEANQEKIKGAIWASFRSTITEKRKIWYFEAVLGTERGDPSPEIFIITVLVEYSTLTEVSANSFFDIQYSPTGIITANLVIGTSKKKLARVVLDQVKDLNVIYIIYNITPGVDSQAKKSLKKMLDLTRD